MSLEPNPKYQEILRLDKMLSKAKISHKCKRLYDGWEIIYPNNEDKLLHSNILEAIEHFGTYKKENDTITIMGLLTKEEEKNGYALGALTAEQAFARIISHYNATDGEAR